MRTVCFIYVFYRSVHVRDQLYRITASTFLHWYELEERHLAYASASVE